MSDSPFLFDVRSLPRRPGSMVEVHRTVVTPLPIGGELIGIPAGGEVEVDLQLQSVSEGVLVTGTVGGATAGQCGRCLTPIDGTVTVTLTELFAYPDSETEQTTDPEDVYRIDDDRIDIEQAVIDTIGTDIPLTPLCDEECRGLCVDCGVRLDDAEPDHGHELIDPRWAGLVGKFGTGSTDTGSTDTESTDTGATGGDVAVDEPGAGRG